MQLFYIPEVTGKTIIPETAESKHMVKVLRLRRGDKVQVVDGKGGFYEAEIADDNPKRCVLSVMNSTQEFGKREFRLHIAIAPTKNNDRFEWFLEKATELGIDEISPVLCDHSERKAIKPDRLEKILVSAMKQSLKAYLPKLNPLITVSELIAANSGNQKFIAHCNEGNKQHLKNVVNAKEDVLVLIGPEGDFSTEEIGFARGNGFTEVTLSKSRLRTETAGVAACQIVNLANE
ncbi:MAG: 16S rRNA (uracil(1498)-N(3))-methyltransferase [Prolixibacteraceae bacterium]